MNKVDKQYLDLLTEIIEKGVKKETRSGTVRSVFCRTMRFNLSEGLPLLTTKKVFVKGIIHELLWFLKGDTNIEYLVDNNVHIWDDDAYRWFKSIIPQFKTFKRKDKEWVYGWYKLDNCCFEIDEINCTYTLITHNNKKDITIDELTNISKEEFINYIKEGAELKRNDIFDGRIIHKQTIYKFGDLGDVYGKQWRKYGTSERDQIQQIINTLNTNPDDRRMVLTGWNPDVLDDVALPACHIFAYFWTRELTSNERIGIWQRKHNLNEEIFNFEKTGLKEHTKEYNLFGDYFYRQTLSEKDLIDIIDNEYNIPKRELSCSFTMRSNDYICGWNFNIVSYSLLTYMICEICNMQPGEIIYNGYDIHVYENHIENAKIQLNRQGYDELPKLKFKRRVNNINEFKYDDFEIINYKSDEPIKFELNVG